MGLGVALSVVLGAFLLSAGSTWAQAPVDPSLKGGLLPQYPRVPQLAHISGDVRASFKIDDSGNVTDIAFVSGPEMLKAPTEASLRSWKFYTADSGAVAVKVETTFSYRISAGCARTKAEREGQTIRFQSIHQIEILVAAICTDDPAMEVPPKNEKGTD